ncbi:MAG TPA: RlpA-like double-psi beta-barrel domain-containing protein [Gaiellaceae bacterium]|nr:RlpA-like double-psi beta-barrel domain-containing protein [Gaiellaceae bacterium]
MTARLARRELVLAAVVLLGAVIAFAVVSSRSDGGTELAKPAGTWYTARVGERAAGGYGKKTACGEVLRPTTEGVSHPVLPCGAKLYLSYHGTTVLTQVIDRGPSSPGRELDATAPVAAKLGLRGVERIRWAYASR